MTNFEDRESDLQFPEHYDLVKMRPITKPTPRWFYERMDGTIVDVSEEEAYMIEKDATRSRKMRRYGFSDGMASMEVFRNCGIKPGQQVPPETAKKIQSDANEAELKVAKGKWQRPKHRSGHFDDSILKHENAESIIRSFGV